MTKPLGEREAVVVGFVYNPVRELIEAIVVYADGTFGRAELYQLRSQPGADGRVLPAGVPVTVRAPEGDE